MEAVPERFEHPHDAAEFKRPARAGVELYRAHIVRYAFDPHTHEAFGLGAIESGVERFRYRGRAETEQGWSYRMVYLDAALLEEVSGERGWWFAQPTAHDPPRAQQVSRWLAAMWDAPDALTGDSALFELLQLLRPHARIGMPRAVPIGITADASLARALALMHDEYASELTLERLAGEAGLSPFHFLRRFKQRYHATPHQMLMALRLFRAKQQLAAGDRPAEVAAAVGLVDQAHLTRRFARMYGVTPARYQAQLRTRPAPQA
jgi:AraC-like DNA-binding protein